MRARYLVRCPWLVPDADVNRWKATHAADADVVAAKWSTGLWFVDSPLMTRSSTGRELRIDDPFAGWNEPAGTNGEPRDLPANHLLTSVFRLEQQTAIDPRWGLSRSSLQWIGGHYSIVGEKPAEHEAKWWERLRRHVNKVAQPYPTKVRQRPWVFPAAAEAVENGLHFSKWG